VSLSADGNTAIVGGPGDFHGYTTGGGAVWVWTRKEGRWSQQGTKLIGLASLFPESGDRSRGTYSQGYSVSLSGDGDTAIVGAPSDPTKIVGPFSTPPTGAAWIWKRSDGIWLQQGTQLVVSDGMWTSQGSSVALSADGKTAIVGGPSVYDGAAWVFDASAVPPRRRGVNH